jgi:2Fe-2S ferredoxin
MPRVTFLPVNVTVELKPDESVFAAARRIDVGIATACAGKGTCGLCRVKIAGGEEHLVPVSAIEKRHLGNTYFITKLRLSCQLKPTGDIAIELPGLQVKVTPKI